MYPFAELLVGLFRSCVLPYASCKDRWSRLGRIRIDQGTRLLSNFENRNLSIGWYCIVEFVDCKFAKVSFYRYIYIEIFIDYDIDYILYYIYILYARHIFQSIPSSHPFKLKSRPLQGSPCMAVRHGIRSTFNTGGMGACWMFRDAGKIGRFRSIFLFSPSTRVLEKMVTLWEFRSVSWECVVTAGWLTCWKNGFAYQCQ